MPLRNSFPAAANRNANDTVDSMRCFSVFFSSRLPFSPARYSSTCPPSSFFIPRHHYCHFCASCSSIYIHLRTTTSHTKRMLMRVSSKVHWRNSAINNATTTTFGRRGSWITCMVCWIFESITFYWSRPSYLHNLRSK